jgi:hypothetical protein
MESNSMHACIVTSKNKYFSSICMRLVGKRWGRWVVGGSGGCSVGGPGWWSVSG